MTNKEYIEEHLKSLRKDFCIAITNNLKEYAKKLLEEIKCSENILKDLEELEYYEKIKLMLKQKNCVIRYIESEECFAVKAILDEYWYKLSKSLVEDNIKEEIEPLPLIDKIKKQKKILEILKNKKVDIKLILWAGQNKEAYNVVVREKNLFSREELTQEEFNLIKEWLNGK